MDCSKKSWRTLSGWRRLQLLLLPALAWTLYSVRELLAAEVIFAAAFLFIALLGTSMYLVGAVAERVAEKAVVRARAMTTAEKVGHRFEQARQ